MSSVNWDKHTLPTGSIDLIGAFEEYENTQRGFYTPGEVKAVNFLRDFMGLAEVTSVAIASLALAQARYVANV